MKGNVKRAVSIMNPPLWSLWFCASSFLVWLQISRALRCWEMMAQSGWIASPCEKKKKKMQLSYLCRLRHRQGDTLNFTARSKGFTRELARRHRKITAVDWKHINKVLIWFNVNFLTILSRVKLTFCTRHFSKNEWQFGFGQHPLMKATRKAVRPLINFLPRWFRLSSHCCWVQVDGKSWWLVPAA